MAEIPITINGRTVEVEAGISVTAALMNAGTVAMRRAVNGRLRGPLCGMGICQECRVTIDGVPHRSGCEIIVQPGMSIQTDD